MQKIKKTIILFPLVPLISWLFFGYAYLANESDLAIAAGIFSILVSFVVGIIEMFLVIYYIRSEKTNETNPPQTQGQSSDTKTPLSFGDGMLTLFTFLYLFSYYFIIGHSLVDFVLVTIAMCSVLGSVYFIKNGHKNMTRTSIIVNVVAMLMLLAYTVLQYGEIYGTQSVGGVQSDSVGPAYWISVMNIGIFAGFFIDFYCAVRLRCYL